jgi:hypothetical protein
MNSSPANLSLPRPTKPMSMTATSLMRFLINLSRCVRIHVYEKYGKK